MNKFAQMKDDVVKILLLTDLSSGYSRGLLRGIVQYAQNRKGWTFYRMPVYYRIAHGDKEVLKWAKKWNVNAIIAQINDIDVKALSNLNIPIIIQNYKDRIPGVFNLTGDYISAGTMAAEYFMKLGYKNFAYYGISESVWSRERYIGYRDRLQQEGYSVYTHFETMSNKEMWVHDFETIGAWLKGLPDNTAVFTCDDYYALHVSETCKIYEIKVPEEIAILGVDNDELLCNISSPPLSSIMIDTVRGGYIAAQVLDELLQKNIKDSFNITLPPLQVITRESTNKHAIQDKFIAKAIEFISQNYKKKIAVADVLELVPYSRRVFENRFRKNTGYGIYQYIQNYRMERMAELLVTTDRTIEDIAISCGLPDNKNTSRIFQKVKGVTPSKFRLNEQKI